MRASRGRVQLACSAAAFPGIMDTLGPFVVPTAVDVAGEDFDFQQA